ncbi:hypothetical protein FGD77_06105 [Roseovarius sp. M141]|nr:hypothetical protein [Roseovarius sp. M141]
MIEEHRTKGTPDRRVQTVKHGSYADHYGRMLPRLRSMLEFRSNNGGWRPILMRSRWSSGRAGSVGVLSRPIARRNMR